MRKNKEKNPHSGSRASVRSSAKMFFAVCCIGVSFICLAIVAFETRYDNKTYPNVYINSIPFGGKTRSEITKYWNEKNSVFADTQFELEAGGVVATVSGTSVGLGFDGELSATQAFLIGRSHGFFTNIVQKFFYKKINLAPYYRWEQDVIDDTLSTIADSVSVPVQDALFTFENGKVTEFRPSKNGRRLNIESANSIIADAFRRVSDTGQQRVVLHLPVEIIEPAVNTDNANAYGIRELIGKGYSEFHGSIPGRIHNVALAASRINGILIKPGDTFSFVDAIGDISAATGYQSAYIIKDGRTVLGDGGGVCQVSTTLFRAAMDAGLPIPERHSHAYRVHYYEEAGYKPGIDATVFSPSVDLKIENDTGSYILIQTKTDTENLSLTFELYGTKDGRKSEILNHQVWGQSPPPEPLYQDDPTIPAGVVKQVDWAAWGAKASFQYRVTRNGETLQDTTFYSNFRPWQAVYLRGTGGI